MVDLGETLFRSRESFGSKQTVGFEPFKIHWIKRLYIYLLMYEIIEFRKHLKKILFN